MKILTLRPWYLGLALLTAVSALALLRAHAQTIPPSEPKPAPTAPGAAMPAGRPPGMPVPGLTQPALPTWSKKSPPKGAAGEAAKPPARQKISRPVSAGAYYAQKMQFIIIPEVELHGVSMEEALELLRAKSRDLDTLEKDPNKKGVNIILKPGGESTLITLSLKDVPMSEALKYITELGGMKYKIEPYAVVVIPMADWLGEMYTRTFEVPPNFLTSATGGKEQTADEILRAHGVMFPEGAVATYVPATSQLIVRNTQLNLDTTEVLVDVLIDAWEKEPQPAPTAPPVAALPPTSSIGTPILTPLPEPALPGLPAPVLGGYGGTIVDAPPSVPPPVVVAPPAARTPGQRQGMRGQVQNGFPPTGGTVDIVNFSADPRARVEQMLRESELKVLLRHYETTVAEIADAGKAIISETDNLKQEALALKIRGLKEWKAKLQADIHALSADGAGGGAGTSSNGIDPTGAPRKVPFLADIPILGPLFVSPGEGTPFINPNEPVTDPSTGPQQKEAEKRSRQEPQTGLPAEPGTPSLSPGATPASPRQ